MVRKLLAIAVAIGISGTSAAYAQMSEPVGAMHHEDAGHHGAAMPEHGAAMAEHDNGHHNGWNKHHRHCRMVWRHHHRVKVCH